MLTGLPFAHANKPAVLPFLSNCENHLQGLDAAYVRLLTFALSLAKSDAVRTQILNRVINASTPLAFYDRPHDSSELQVMTAVRPLVSQLTASQWESVKVAARDLVKNSADQSHDRKRQEANTSELLGLMHVPEYDIEFNGGAPLFVDMGDYEVSINHLQELTAYRIDKTNGAREIIGTNPSGRFLNRPILFPRTKDSALAVSLSAGFQIHVIKVTKTKIEILQNFEVRDAKRVDHFRLPDGRDMVTIQKEARVDGREMAWMILYEVTEDGELQFRSSLMLEKLMTQMQVAELIETSDGPSYALHSLGELGQLGTFTLNAQTLELKTRAPLGPTQYDRRPLQPIRLKSGADVYLSSNGEGLLLFQVEDQTGLPKQPAVIAFSREMAYWAGFHFKYQDRDLIAASGSGEIAIFEIRSATEIVKLAHYLNKNERTMHGFGFHVTADDRIVLATSIGDAVQLFDYNLKGGLTLLDEVKESLQSQHPHFIRSADGREDFMLTTRKNRLETFRLKKTLQKSGSL